MLSLICTICHDSLWDDNHTAICSLPCGHVFHAKCISTWFNRSQTCPHCRVQSSPDQVFKLYFEVTDIEGDQPSLENLKAELRKAKLALQDMDKLTKECNELSTLNGSLKEQLNVSNCKMLRYKAMTINLEKQKEQLIIISNALQVEREKTSNLTKAVQKYSNFKTLLEGPIKEATEVLDSSFIDMITLKTCYLAVKRNLSAVVSSETKLKADYSSLHVAFKKLEKSNAELTEQLLLRDSIIEECKNLSRRRTETEKITPSSSMSREDEPIEGPSPKKRTILPLRRSSRDVPRVSATDLLKMKPSKNSQFTYDGFGGHSRDDTFPAARLKRCKIVTNRKKLN